MVNAIEEMLHQVLDDNLQAKIKEGAITPEQVEPFKAAIAEECRVFDKIEMSGFMLFMSELVTWCKSHGIPIGFNRGSCGWSRVAYVTNPQQTSILRHGIQCSVASATKIVKRLVILISTCLPPSVIWFTTTSSTVLSGKDRVYSGDRHYQVQRLY